MNEAKWICADCGYPNPPSRAECSKCGGTTPVTGWRAGSGMTPRARALFYVFLLLAVCLCVSVWLSSPPPETGKEATSEQSAEDQKIAIMSCAQVCVQQYLKAPGSATFSPPMETTLIPKGDRYGVIGWVDSQNSFGAKLRSSYACVMQRTGPGDADYSPLRIVIDEQIVYDRGTR